MGVGEGESGHEQRDCETDPRECREPDDMPPTGPWWQPADVQPDCHTGESGASDAFAHYEPRRYTEGNSRPHRLGEADLPKVHSGIGQREDGND